MGNCFCTDTSTDTRRLEWAESEQIDAASRSPIAAPAAQRWDFAAAPIFQSLPPPMEFVASDHFTSTIDSEDPLSTYYEYRQRTKTLYTMEELEYLRNYSQSAKEASKKAKQMDSLIESSV